MTRRALLSGSRAATTTTTPAVPYYEPLAYALPTTAPYNVPSYLVTPTPDGSGEMVHPCVVDFGQARWHGFRYWMAVTPQTGNSDAVENPCILVSNNAVEWAPPPGLTNPIAPKPEAEPAHNSDTHLIHDPTSDVLWCVYRESVHNATRNPYETIIAKSSADGVHWSAPVVMVGQNDLNTNRAMLSPSVIRKGEGDWWMTFCPGSTWRAPSIAGPWTKVSNHAWTNRQGAPWHSFVMWDAARSRWLMLAEDGDLFTATSPDCITWTKTSAPIVPQTRPGAWDNTLYRSCFTLHENGTGVRVWYSSGFTAHQGWRIGYTQMPLTVWTTPA